MTGAPPHAPRRRATVAAVAPALLLSAVAAAQPPAPAPPVDPERLMFPDLARQPAPAVELARKADAARRLGDFARAAALYGQAAAAAPGYAPFLRRQCGAEVAQKRWDEALALCRKAVELDPTPENLLGAAVALSRFHADELPPEQAAEVRRLIERAHARDDERSRMAACEVIAMSGTMALTECSRGPLGDLDPETLRIASAAAEAARGQRPSRTEARLVGLLAAAAIGLVIAAVLFGVRALGRALAGLPRPPRTLRRARGWVGGRHVLSAERATLAEPEALESVVRKLLAMAGGADTEDYLRVDDWGDVLRVTLRVRGLPYRTELRREGARTDAAPLLTTLNEMLGDIEAEGTLHEIAPVDAGEGRLVVVHATKPQVRLLQREGLLGEPFSLPAEEATGLPFQPRSRVDFHANGRIASALLARVHRVQGVPCAPGAPVRWGEGGKLLSATLGAACAAHGLTLPAGSEVELDEAGTITRATLGAEAALEGVRYPAGTGLRYRAGRGWRLDAEAGGSYRGG